MFCTQTFLSSTSVSKYYYFFLLISLGIHQEGMKLYRGYDGRVRLFRPELNCRRFRMSAFRGGLPDFDPAELEKLIVAFLAVDADHWLPEPGTFLYVRPALIGTNAALGVSRPSSARLFVVAVLFPQFAQSGPGLKLLCSDTQVRAWPGGFGNAKVRIFSFLSVFAWFRTAYITSLEPTTPLL